MNWNAKWIAAPAGLDALPVFRRAVEIEALPSHAQICICGLGHFELRVNGRKVGEDLLEPGWTDYRKTCLYVRRDISQLLNIGENTVDVLLGNGMFNVVGARYRKFKGSFGEPMLIAQLSLQFGDGGVQTLITDETWKCAAGPITLSSIYGGEDHNARRESPTNWRDVQIVAGPGGELIEQTHPPIRAMQKFDAVKVTEPKPGVRVYDFGQNMSGRPRLTARGTAGATIQLSPSELLSEDGTINQKPVGSPVSFNYTLHGGGGEIWSPRFSYTGFRYLQTEGAIESITKLEAEFIHCSAAQVGQFECSDELINRIHALIIAAMKSNTQSVFTDCPHREKLGWLEQTHLCGPGLLYNFDLKSLFAKVSRDMRDAQHENGTVPTIAPQYTSFKPPWDIFNDSPEWGVAAIINPWLVFQLTGDASLIEQNFDVMQKYADYLASRAGKDGIIAYGLSDWYDIGPGHAGFCKLTTLGVTATAIYIQAMEVMERCARRLLLSPKTFQERGALARAAFNARFFDSTKGFFDTGSQTAQAMPLALGIVDQKNRAGVLEHLINDIRAHNNHITAGDVGFRYVLEALASAGRNDVVLDILQRTDPPSYGAQLAAGATTLTEAWDASPRNSQNHFMLGHAEEWFYRHFAGIQIDFSKPPDEQIVFRPAIVGDVRWVRAKYETPDGPIALHWNRDGQRVQFELAVHANRSALLYVAGETVPRKIGAGVSEIEVELSS